DIYRPHIAASDPAIVARRNIEYGPHARHRFDLYRCGSGPRSVLVFIHGGGFVAGSKDEDGTFHRNVGEYFARHGYAAIVPNYRLAPSDPWPAGAQDIDRLLRWVVDHNDSLDAIPHAINIVGQSAGASHVATWLFDPTLKTFPRPNVEAVILMAGFYKADAPLTPPIQSHFGADASVYAERSPITHVAKQHPRLLLTIGEFDPGDMAQQTYLMAAALSKADAASARLHWFAGHNHVSTVQSLGCPQDDVGEVLRSFLAQ
ncbi:MAG: alpha/beta hydrolase, partial [Betaproteobacteria bacterium]|nr:alpha/beta hydrolase [Betaproteobacteria bacterium]